MSQASHLQREWPTEQQEAYIKELAIWKNPIKLEPLPGGLQNRNYVATDGGTKYVVRVASDLLHIGGVLSSTNAAMETASEAGVSPKLVYQEPYLSAVDFIYGRNLTIDDFKDPKHVEGSVERIKAFQAASDRVHRPMTYFDPFVSCRQSVWSAEQLGVKLIGEYKPLLKIVDRLETHFGVFKPVATHCDLAYVNIMLGDDGRYWLIDWDLAGFGPPDWDIAELAGYSYTSDEIDRHFVKCFFGELAPEEFERRLFRHRAYKMTSLIRVTYLLLILDARLGFVLSGDELKASMAENFAEVGGDYIDFVRTHAKFFEGMWKTYGDAY